jgi:hypothetical protein
MEGMLNDDDRQLNTSNNNNTNSFFYSSKHMSIKLKLAENLVVCKWNPKTHMTGSICKWNNWWLYFKSNKYETK